MFGHFPRSAGLRLSGVWVDPIQPTPAKNTTNPACFKTKKHVTVGGGGFRNNVAQKHPLWEIS